MYSQDKVTVKLALLFQLKMPFFTVCVGLGLVSIFLSFNVNSRNDHVTGVFGTISCQFLSLRMYYWLLLRFIKIRIETDYIGWFCFETSEL